MNYEFPHITHINQVLPHVKDRDDFSVVEKDDHIIISYNLMTPDTFPDIQSEGDKILRECRGITFDKETGKVISRKLQKFFNLGERNETRPEVVDLTRKHVILEKLDGSMIVPVMHKGGWIRWHTKRGLSDTAFNAEVFVAKNPKYREFAALLLARGLVPIFEWCSRQDQIVLDYPQDNLILLAIRNLHTGWYDSYDLMRQWAAEYNIPVVVQHNPYQLTTDEIIQLTRCQEGAEGIIIRFEDGHMLKVKSDWYCQLHRVISNFVWEYNVINLILDGQVDDLQAVLVQHGHALANELNVYVAKFWEIFNAEKDKINAAFFEIYEPDIQSRKDFALKVQESSFSHLKRPILFSILDGKDCKDELVKKLKCHCANNSKWQNLKSKTDFGKLQWNYRQ